MEFYMSNQNKIVKPFYDLKHKDVRPTPFFFLENILKARADLHLESGLHEYDQEVNIYIAGLLNSLLESDRLIKQKPYISPFDTDVRHYLDDHPGLRNEYLVYRDNADFGLILLGLFLGYEHPSLYSQTVLANKDNEGRIALYYEFAASALAHLQGNSASLVNIFLALSEHIKEITHIMRYAAVAYFDLLEKISDGTFYHLEKDLANKENKGKYEAKLDQFLKLFAQFKENPSEEIIQKIKNITNELHELNEKFHFDETCLQDNNSNGSKLTIS